MQPARTWTLAATIIGSSLTFIDGTVVNVALPALQADLRATMTDVQWVIEAYALLLGALILVGGSLGDQFGRRRVFVAGVLIFTAASVLCGFSASTRVLIAGRALQGAGAALLVPGSLAIISATFDGGSRGRAIGVWSGFTAITSAAGPVLGGWLIEHVSWRAVFFLNVPLAVVVLVLSGLYMEESRDPSRSSRIDWTGALLAALGLGMLVWSLLEWPRRGGSAIVSIVMAAGVACLAAFVHVERTAPNPMLPLTVFRSRTFTLANGLTLLLYAALSMVLFLVPMNLIQVQRYTSTEAGAALLPLPIILFVLSRWSGGLVGRIGRRVPLTAGPAIAALGVALYARPAVGGAYWTTFFPAAVVLGVGMALTVAPLTTTAMEAVEREHAGVASGINNAVARVAALLAIAAFGVVLVQEFRERASDRLDRIGLSAAARAQVERELPKMAGADVTSIAADPSQRDAARHAVDGAFVGAFRLVMIDAAALALAAAAVGAAIRSGR